MKETTTFSFSHDIEKESRKRSASHLASMFGLPSSETHETRLPDLLLSC